MLNVMRGNAWLSDHYFVTLCSLSLALQPFRKAEWLAQNRYVTQDTEQTVGPSPVQPPNRTATRANAPYSHASIPIDSPQDDASRAPLCGKVNLFVPIPIPPLSHDPSD